MNNSFGSFPPMVLLEVCTDDQGHLINMATSQPLHLTPNVELRLLVYPQYVLAAPPKFEPKKRQVLEPNETLTFVLNKTHWGKSTVKVRFPYGLLMFQNKATDLPCCPEEVHCIVESVIFGTKPYSPPEFEPFEVSSLNQAYFQTSKRYEPTRKSHSVDAYHAFRTENGKLLREVWKQLETQG